MGAGARGREAGRRGGRSGRKAQPATDKWWVDTSGVDRAPEARTPSGPVGSRFFAVGAGFDQDEALERLTDDNVKLIEAAGPPEGGWAYTRLGDTAYPERELARIKELVVLPAYARGVIVDCGRSVRLLVTGTPPGERLLELTLGEEPSFDCWIRHEWVREAVYPDAERALHALNGFIEEYLSPGSGFRRDAGASRP